MLSFLRKLFRHRQRVTTIRRRPRLRLTLEMLEDRYAPAILTVNSVADNTAADNALTLREAIAIVDGNLGRSLTTAESAQVAGTLGSNDMIQFNLPAGPQTITLTGGTLSITKNVTINGPGASLLTANGNKATRDFYVGSSFSQNLKLVVSMSNLTITGGNQGYGSGVFSSGTLALTNVTVSNNTATSNGGGGIYNNGNLTLTNCAVTGNTTKSANSSSTAGGGLLNLSAGTVTISNCTFTNNTAPGTGSSAGSGGAIDNSGTMSIAGSAFTGNTCGSDGAGIHSDGTLTVTTTFSANVSSADGGAIRADVGSKLTLTASTVAGNTATSEGGGIDASAAASVTITNSTFTNNTAGSIGGGLNCGLGTVSLVNDTITGNRVNGIYGGCINIRSSTVTLDNTIVAGNFQGVSGTTPNDITGYNFSNTKNLANASSAFNLIGVGGSGGLVNGANGNQVGVTNLGLGALANNGGPTQTIALLSGSPAIDHGSNAYVTAGETDQRSLSRIVNGTVDIGAFEVQ